MNKEMKFVLGREEKIVGKGENGRYGDFKSLTNGKILDWFRLKAFAEDKINMNKKLKFVLGRGEKLWEK